jgi:hypothetical protein
MSVQAINQANTQAATSTATATTAAAAKPATAASKSDKPMASSAPPSSTQVTISSAARAALVEATETAAQTAKEAGTGDLQAQRLLAKEQQAHQS